MDLVTFRPPPGLPPPGLTALRLPADRAAPAEGTADIAMLHPGSIGHPYACNKPCVFLLKGFGCEAGSACDYCHLRHSRDLIKPDKRQRQMIRELTDGARLSLCLPQIRLQAERRNFFSQANPVIRLLEAELQKLNAPISPPDIPGLRKVLACMSFPQLVRFSMNQRPTVEILAALAQLKLELPRSL